MLLLLNLLLNRLDLILSKIEISLKIYRQLHRPAIYTSETRISEPIDTEMPTDPCKTVHLFLSLHDLSLPYSCSFNRDPHKRFSRSILIAQRERWHANCDENSPSAAIKPTEQR